MNTCRHATCISSHFGFLLAVTKNDKKRRMSLYDITTDNLGFQTYDLLGTSLILTSVMYAAQIHVTPRTTAK